MFSLDLLNLLAKIPDKYKQCSEFFEGEFLERVLLCFPGSYVCNIFEIIFSVKLNELLFLADNSNSSVLSMEVFESFYP